MRPLKGSIPHVSVVQIIIYLISYSAISITVRCTSQRIAIKIHKKDICIQ